MLPQDANLRLDWRRRFRPAAGGCHADIAHEMSPTQDIWTPGLASKRKATFGHTFVSGWIMMLLSDHQQEALQARKGAIHKSRADRCSDRGPFAAQASRHGPAGVAKIL